MTLSKVAPRRGGFLHTRRPLLQKNVKKKREMERTLLPAVDLALPVSTGPESSSVSDLAYNGSVTGTQVLLLYCLGAAPDSVPPCLSETLRVREVLFCLMVTCVAWGHTTRILGTVDNAVGGWSDAVGSPPPQLQQR